MKPIHPRDSRAWLGWGAAAMIPVLVTRNPFILVEVLLIAAIVRGSCVPPERLTGWRWFVRIALLMVLVGTFFNVLTVRAGDLVILTIPSAIPWVGGDLTFNALIYGVVSGWAFFTLVLIGTTTAALLRWAELIRVLPARMAPLAVAGSVAWAFLPQMGATMREIRETQLMRGQRMRGLRDFLPLLVPLLAGGLERALTTAEALEARGFGAATTSLAPPATSPARWRGGMAMVTGLAALLAAAYEFAAGSMIVALAAGGVGIALVALGLRWQPVSRIAVTSYRRRRWNWRDSVIVLTALMAFTGFAWRWMTVPGRLQFDVYPTLTWPPVDPLAMLALALLIAPSLIPEWVDSAP